MQRTEEFHNVFFSESVLREAVEIVEKHIGQVAQWRDADITEGMAQWAFDSETEFFAEYGSNLDSLSIRAEIFKDGPSDYVDVSGPLVSIYIYYSQTRWRIQVTARNRDDLLAPFAPFRKNLEQYRLPAPPPPPQPPLKIFIGHGRSQHWRDLKDALQDHHGYQVETFETHPRAGYTIPEAIQSMAYGNALALMVVTAEDEQIDGSVRARENVVHEFGYFQGRLGNKRAILIMEDGVNEPGTCARNPCGAELRQPQH